jgi:Tol biopolymer transport system component
LYLKNADGSQEEQLIPQDGAGYPADWSPGGKYLLYERRTEVRMFFHQHLHR